MKFWHVVPASLLFGGLSYFFLGGIPLLFVFVMLWSDKFIIRFLVPDILGIELITISTIVAGIVAGPLNGAILMIVTIPTLEGIKSIALPLNRTDFPPFVPSPYNFVDGMVAALAGSFPFTDLLFLTVVALLMKFVANSIIDMRIFNKPFNMISAVSALIFNILLVFSFETFLLAIIYATA